MGQAAVEFMGGYITPSISANAEYTTNAENASDSSGDTILRLSPSLTYATSGATVRSEVSLGFEAVRYLELTGNDADNIDFSLSFSYPNGVDLPYSLALSASVLESTESDIEFGEVTRNRNYNAAVSGSYQIQSNYAFATGFSYSQTDPLSGEDRSSTQSYAVPFTVNYSYSELLQYGLNYRVRFQKANDFENGDAYDHAIYGSVNGQISPLINGSFNLGLQLRTSDNGGDELAPYASVSADWKISELTSMSLSLDADFETSTGNFISSSYSSSLSLRHSMTTTLSGNLSASANRSEELEGDSRSLHSYTLSGGLNLSIWRASSIGINSSIAFNENPDGARFNTLALSLNFSHKF